MMLQLTNIAFALLVWCSVNGPTSVAAKNRRQNRNMVRDPSFWRQPGLELRTPENILRFITKIKPRSRGRERRHQLKANQCGGSLLDDAQLSHHHLCGLRNVPVKIRIPKSLKHIKERVIWQNPTVAMVGRCTGVCQKYGNMKCTPRGRKERIKVKTRIRWDHKNETDCYEVTVKSHTDCQCRCPLTFLHCQKFGANISLDKTTCSCKCHLTEEGCNEKMYRRLNKDKCECEEKIDYYDEYDDYNDT